MPKTRILCTVPDKDTGRHTFLPCVINRHAGIIGRRGSTLLLPPPGGRASRSLGDPHRLLERPADFRRLAEAVAEAFQAGLEQRILLVLVERDALGRSSFFW